MPETTIIHQVPVVLKPKPSEATALDCDDSRVDQRTERELRIRRDSISGMKQQMRFMLADPATERRYHQAFTLRDGRSIPWPRENNLQISPAYEFGSDVEIVVVLLNDPLADPYAGQVRLLKRRVKIRYEGGGGMITDDGPES